jgi:thiamine-monophosphate kinase
MKPGYMLSPEGLLALADAHGCELIGGDTTRGPLNICITVFGEVPAGTAPRPGQRGTQAILRSGAQAGDDIYVSGTLGDARLALQALQGRMQLPAEVLGADPSAAGATYSTHCAGHGAARHRQRCG